MATTPKKKPRRRNLETVRQMAETKAKARKRPSRFKTCLKWLWLPFRLSFNWLNQPVPTHAQAKQGSLMSGLTQSRAMVPAYIRHSWAEIKLVTWPGFTTAMRLTLAVFIFACFFAVLVAILDKGLTEVFEELILNRAKNFKEFILK